MRSIKLTLMVFLMLSRASLLFGQSDHPDRLPLESQQDYQIAFGSLIEAYIGQRSLMVPVWLENEQPVELVHLIINYDPSLLEPIVVSPAMFFQHFNFDVSVPGRIVLEIERNLAPPPYVPPIPAGDTILAYIAMDVIAEDLGMDITTFLDFYEDPNTPYPDNLLMLESGTFIVPPQLVLTTGTVYIYSPDYGDLNLNGYPFEVGDVVVFVAYFTGQVVFTAEQMANSDCNRDGIQATVSDLVYMLLVINGMPDTLWVSQPQPPVVDELYRALATFNSSPPEDLTPGSVLSVMVSADVPIGGFALTIEFPQSVTHISDVGLGRNANGLMLASKTHFRTVKTVAYSLDGYVIPEGDVELLTIPFESSGMLDANDFKIVSAGFSDGSGFMVDAECEIALKSRDGDDNKKDFVIKPVIQKPKAYPNPFNSAVSISFALGRPAAVSIEIFDLLGRSVRRLADEHLQAGNHILTWDGRNQEGREVATGVYLCRIATGTEDFAIKLHYIR